MNWYEIQMTPRDVVFFRGAKPMNASAIGEGVRWPFPSVFHHSLLSAFHRKWPENQNSWEIKHRYNSSKDKNRESSFRFGGLQSLGLFPCKDNMLYYPTPADIKYCNNNRDSLCLLKPTVLSGKGNLPQPLKYALMKTGEPVKEKPPSWIPHDKFCAYLCGNFNFQLLENLELYDEEYRPGIEIDDKLHTVIEGQFYLAQYMRFRENISLKGYAGYHEKEGIKSYSTNLIQRFFEDGESNSIIMGGQQGVLHITGKESQYFSQSFPISKDSGSRFVKWILLTPAIFNGGWLPGWVDRNDGSVFQYFKLPREPGESRDQWRMRISSENRGREVLGRLVAACVPKALVLSGWRAYGGRGNAGAKPGRLCVPAGSVYYFEVDRDGDPENIIQFLHGQCRSDISAEKGFGFGVCAYYNNPDSLTQQGERK